MPANSIPDWKKATIVALSQKHGYRSISNKLGVSKNTVKKYKERAENNGKLEMNGVDLEINDER